MSNDPARALADTLAAAVGGKAAPPVPPILEYFRTDHLPPHLRRVSEHFHAVALAMLEATAPNAEQSAGLRKLLEAKDCFVRAALPGGRVTDDARIEQAAKAAHEANNVLRAALGEPVKMPWEHMNDEFRATVRGGVRNFIAMRSAGVPRDAMPAASHASWCQAKIATGWAHGPKEDANLKLHPCLVPYEDLPAGQRLKDELFLQVVSALV